MKPMLADSINVAAIGPYLEDPNYWLQQKLDGDRILMRVIDGEVTALNREGEVRRNPVPRKIFDAFRDLPGTWFFDGELVDDTFWIFDLPVADTAVGIVHPYEFRLDVLHRIFAGWSPPPCVRLLPTAKDHNQKSALFERIRADSAEGAILRRFDGQYRPGKRSAVMLKAKFVRTVDVVITTVGLDDRASATYGLYDNGALVPAGSCSTAGRPHVKVGDVAEIRYLYASDTGQLYQPVLLRLREDKSASQCTVDQLQFTNRRVIETLADGFSPAQRRAMHILRTNHGAYVSNRNGETTICARTAQWLERQQLIEIYTGPKRKFARLTERPTESSSR